MKNFTKQDLKPNMILELKEFNGDNRIICYYVGTSILPLNYGSFLNLSDFSEDKRKYAHTTATYSLNQTDEEKKIGIMRLGELVVRESEFDRTRQVKVLQCLQRGRPFIGSYF